MLEYSEYKSLVDILNQSDVSNTYSDLMAKEEKVLDTVNHVVKNIRDDKEKHQQFIHLSLYEVFMLFFTEMPKIIQEVLHMKQYQQLSSIFTKNHRLMLIGILFICISIFFFFIDISK